ncbi:CPBP family intramembrane glutamic endopeptidase [Paenibacillus sp. USHLN196]|uniref:CPBP family intramembrane glutamic endopeptidase n=1 Tax=Paenibacillus sp. USHLN196 TaxID=3081291 RepID=UPI00301A6547
MIDHLFRLRRVIVSIMIILVSASLYWRLMLWFQQSYMKSGYSQLHHLLMGVTITLLVLITLYIAGRCSKENLKWREHRSFRTKLSSFITGFLIWLIPATFGVTLCITLGWSNVSILNTPISDMLLGAGLLMISVFLIEALPEELIFRGFVFKLLQSILPLWWSVVMIQTVLFSLFAWVIGALYSSEQIQFIPGFALILGYLRAVSGTVWVAIGFHTAIMTFAQFLGPIHGYVWIEGMKALQFTAFVLFPSALGGIFLSFIYPKPDWKGDMP